jgi:DNA primase small subunit
MNEVTRNFIRTKFREYYRHANMILPGGLSSREWGFMFLDSKFMRRHKSFSSHQEAISYIREMVPLHVYYSSALYEYPGATTMDGKHWLGADLIFDLDADHLPRAKTLSYEDMLEEVKKETLKLLVFITDDFGLEEIGIAFSGGRGYHVHVFDDSVRELGSVERREIVDYVTGVGLSTNFVFQDKMMDDQFKTVMRGGRRIEVAQTTKRIVSFDKKDGGFGWGKRVGEYLSSYMHGLGRKDDEDARREICEIMKTRKIKEILEVARRDEAIERIKKKGIVDIGDPRFFNAIIERTIEERGVGVKPDEPVTCDTKRLIRLPTSIHGGTGLQVKPVEIDAMEDFVPLNDAIIFGNDLVSTKVLTPCSITMRGEKFEIGNGTTKLPEYVAIFLMCRGMVEYEPRGNLEFA